MRYHTIMRGDFAAIMREDIASIGGTRSACARAAERCGRSAEDAEDRGDDVLKGWYRERATAFRAAAETGKA